MKDVLLVFLFLLTLSGCRKKTNKADTTVGEIEVKAGYKTLIERANISENRMTAYACLDLETAAGLPVYKSDYLILDKFVNQLEPNIHLPETFSKVEILSLLKRIDDVIKTLRHDVIEYNGTFAMCLRYRLFDCDINSLLFLSIADKLDLPIYGVLFPNHMVILWKDEQHSIYWETVESRVRTEEFYMSRFDLEKEKIGKGGLGKLLSKQELKALMIYNIGKSYADSHKNGKAIQYLREASELFPEWHKPYNTMAHVYQNMRMFENAIYYSNIALKKYDKEWDMYALRAYSWQSLGCINEAIDVYSKLLKEMPEKYGLQGLSKSFVRQELRKLKSI